jgi:hypothetical protein
MTITSAPCQYTTTPHDPHFYVRWIAGGEPGPIPYDNRICPGVTA